MASWTSERSAILSMMLDVVSGTEKIVTTRQDFARVCDCIASCLVKTSPHYFTGSKAEGLDLPGSDEDYMYDINGKYNIRVVQTTQETRVASSPRTSFLLFSTDGVHPGFALLRWLSPIPHPLLLCASQNLNGLSYLSSSLFTRETQKANQPQADAERTTTCIQGPSIESWDDFMDKSKSGVDNVYSIHCPFWPRGAEEWLHRPRYCGWPTPTDITQITDFGCHVVAVGFPLSSNKTMEWRVSFSIAERILVWSFNHVQIQCYAVMKIILKEFIKVRCSPPNYVLCSYFIKTFLFWKFEVTESTFWRPQNFRACIAFLLVEFTRCIRDRELQHYFFPSFNLLSVKLTREAQRELLLILETAIEHDIAILRECNTLREVWSRFTTTDCNINRVMCMINKTNIVKNDECLMFNAHQIYFWYDSFTGPIYQPRVPLIFTQLTTGILAGRYTTSLAPLVLKYHALMSNIPHRVPRNHDAYKLGRLAQSDASSVDISTCKLWYAMVLLRQTDYAACLSTVNDVLSRIPPYALYMSGFLHSSRESTSLYERVYLESDTNDMERLRTSWLTDMKFSMTFYNIVPLAVRIELDFIFDGLSGVRVSPFIFAYYLMFLCHHELHQFVDRDRALRLLVDTVCNREQGGGILHHALNIVGHCAYLTGQRNVARLMFNSSYKATKRHYLGKYNSAAHYLTRLPW